MKKRYTLLLFIFFLFSFMRATELYKIPSLDNKEGSKTVSDEVFLRRTYLVLTGRIPSVDKVKLFLESKETQKRKKLIDELLDSDEYVRYMQMHWGDILRIKSEFPSNLWPNGVQAYNQWLYEKISTNTPYDVMVQELLLSKGSNFREPAVNFFRAFQNRTPENIYANINLLFLGTRNVPDAGKICFSQLKYKSTKEWKEEIVYVDILKDANDVQVKMPDGKLISLQKGTDWRVPYVDWLTSKEKNSPFAAVMANRLWYWVFGKGIVQEPDDWGSHNPPKDAQLMENLTNQFIDMKFDMKAYFRFLLNSDAFQSAADDNKYFLQQRLPAEVIVDALADITGISDSYRSRVPEPFTFYPEGTRSRDLGDGTVSSSTLELFGRVSRDLSLESQRSNKVTSRQLLYLMNSSELEERIRKSESLTMICNNQKNPEQVCNEVTLLVLSRHPSPQEITLFKQYAAKNKFSLRDLATEIVWTQINSVEFLYNH